MLESHAYHFDCDLTLTTDFLGAGKNNAQLIKRLATLTLRILAALDCPSSIISMNNEDIIKEAFKGAGVVEVEGEIPKIIVFGADSSDINSGYKKEKIRELAFASDKFKHATVHHYFDDYTGFCDEVRTLAPEFTAAGKTLIVTQIYSIPEVSFLLDILRRHESDITEAKVGAELYAAYQETKILLIPNLNLSPANILSSKYAGTPPDSPRFDTNQSTNFQENDFLKQLSNSFNSFLSTLKPTENAQTVNNSIEPNNEKSNCRMM